ncbi:hypothetical protein [Pseudorhodoplanes sp.]|uniref:hypothetical protein n=1 Tax=Pseudorhodoplanes sp. TaxID=1934341 RepID=UPI002C12FE02|nr:hypothetical protein [Pseudorhodoplanes sp.]HWV54467.1 hypothetical protein [Pseudorhodoplanes sp.]
MTALQIPLVVTLSYTAFMAVLIPVYLYRYGPTNFLYFCDIALLFTLAGLWLDSPLLISMCAVGLLLPQTLWVIDYIFNLFGKKTTGLTDYMFDKERSPFLRGLSLFHGWLPFLLVYLVWEMGYDSRAFWAWTAVSCIVLPICYGLMPPAQPDPGMTPVNINMVWGFDDRKPQTWMSPNAWFAMLFFGLPIAVYWPTHLLLQAVFKPAG